MKEGLLGGKLRLSSRTNLAVASLREIERALARIDEREILLSRLAPRSADLDVPVSSDVVTDDDQEPDKVLRGPAIREAAVEILVSSGRAEALHYREWFELLTRAGYEVAGKNALAVFLTQLSRSPAVRKSTQTGVYELDRQAPQRLARELERLQGELRELTARPSGAADLSEIRARREQLTGDIGRAERALDEARRVLSVDATDASTPAAPLLATG